MVLPPCLSGHLSLNSPLGIIIRIKLKGNHAYTMKQKLNLSINQELVKALRRRRLNVSALVEKLLVNHVLASQNARFLDVEEVPGSKAVEQKPMRFRPAVRTSGRAHSFFFLISQKSIFLRRVIY